MSTLLQHLYIFIIFRKMALPVRHAQLGIKKELCLLQESAENDFMDKKDHVIDQIQAT